MGLPEHVANRRRSVDDPGGDDLDIFETDALQLVGDELGGLLDVAFVLFQGADAGNAEEFFEFFKKRFSFSFA